MVCWNNRINEKLDYLLNEELIDLLIEYEKKLKRLILRI